MIAVESPVSSRAPVMTITVLAGMAFAVFWFVFSLIRAPLIPTDDAFITYRYAANLVNGYGLVYNPGEYVLGTTAPGYAILLSVFAALTRVELLPEISRLVNIAAILIAAVGGFALSWHLLRSLPLSCGVFITALLSPAAFDGIFAGMEGPVFIALVTLALLALVKSRWRAAALLMSLLPTIRPEGVFFIALVGLIFLLGLWRGQIQLSRRRLVEIFLLLVIPGIVWLAFSTVYYGSPLPHSITAKQAGVYPIGLLGSTIGALNGMADNFIALRLINNEESSAVLVGFGLFLTLFAFTTLLSFRWLARQQPFLTVLPLFTLVMIGFYATSGTVVFGYYHTNYDFFARIVWWVGLYILFSEIAARSLNRRRARSQAALIALITLLITLFPAFRSLSSTLLQSPTTLSGDSLRQLLYRDLAHHIEPYLPDDVVILMPEIGELGFILDEVTVLDAVGLVSPQAVPYLPVPPEQRAGLGIGAIPPALVQDYRPDMLIFFDIFAVNGLGKEAWFWEEYTSVIVHQVRLPGWDSNALYVVARNDYLPRLNIPAFTSPIH